MGISVGTVRSNDNDQRITSYSRGVPNWAHIPTAAKIYKTEAEFVAEIKELAYKAATTINKAEKDALAQQVLKLRTEYLSDVAPDRKSMYQSARNAVGKNSSNNTKCRGIGELSLLAFLEQAEGRGNLAKKQFALAGGGMLSCPILTTGGHGVVIEYQGVKILSNTGDVWGYEMTPAEQTKSKQFYSIYWGAYRSVKDNGELIELPSYLEEQSAFDTKA